MLQGSSGVVDFKGVKSDRTFPMVKLFITVLENPSLYDVTGKPIATADGSLAKVAWRTSYDAHVIRDALDDIGEGQLRKR